MNRSVSRWQTAGFVFTSVLGTLLHFLFDWCGQSALAALFSAVNESIWEHMKLLYYPMLLFSFVEYRAFGTQFPHFWCVKFWGLLLGLTLIPVLYYTYTGILGTSADWFNVTIFFLAAGAVYRLETALFHRDIPCRAGWAAFSGMILIGLLFTLLTFFPAAYSSVSGSRHRDLRLSGMNGQKPPETAAFPFTLHVCTGNPFAFPSG